MTYSILEFPKDTILLRRKARLVQADEFGSQPLLDFSQRLGDTMMQANGMGLASTQVEEAPGGEAWAMFALRSGAQAFGIVINPEIVSQSNDRLGQEGCLSFASVIEMMRAPEKVLLRGVSPSGEAFELSLTEIHARAAWHEAQHLQGRLIIDRMSRMKRQLFMAAVGKARRR